MVQAVGGMLLGGGRHQALPPGARNVVGAQAPVSVQLYQEKPADAEGQHPVAGEQAAHQVSPLVDQDLEKVGQDQEGGAPQNA